MKEIELKSKFTKNGLFKDKNKRGKNVKQHRHKKDFESRKGDKERKE